MRHQASCYYTRGCSLIACMPMLCRTLTVGGKRYWVAMAFHSLLAFMMGTYVTHATENELASGDKITDSAPWPLSIEDALLLALDNNPDLQVQSFEMGISEARQQQEEGRFSTRFFAEATMRDVRSTETARATGEQFDAEIEQSRLTAGLQRRFSTGTDVSLALRQVSEDSNRAPSQDEAAMTLSFSQSLLQGGGRNVNLAAVRRARLGVELSDWELNGYTEYVVANVEQAYWLFWLASETISIAEQALAVAEKQHQDVLQRIEVGQLARNESSVSNAEVARRRQTLIDAQANLTRRRIELLSMIAPDQHSLSIIPSSLPGLPELNDPPEDLERRLTRADLLRSDLQEARLRMQQRQLDTMVTRNGLLPRLEFFADLSKTGFGEDSGNAWSNLDDNGYDVQAGIRLVRPLGNREERARDAESRFRLEQAELAIVNLRERIGTEILLALNELHRAQRQIEASAETRRLQALTVQAEEERFQVGAGTTLTVAQAQRDLLESMIAEQRALVQGQQALLDLYRAEGILLQQRGISGPAKIPENASPRQ